MAEEIENVPLASGVVLLSHPMLKDPNFRRSVILICEHRLDGSVGLVLNDMTNYQIGEVVEELSHSQQSLFRGGPVETDSMHMIHNLSESLSEAQEVLDDLFWGGSFEDLKDYLAIYNSNEEQLRLFSGYSGWSEGQLQVEVDEGAWIVTRSDAKTLFGSSPEKLWRTILRSMGRRYAILANFPDDLRLN